MTFLHRRHPPCSCYLNGAQSHLPSSKYGLCIWNGEDVGVMQLDAMYQAEFPLRRIWNAHTFQPDMPMVFLQYGVYRTVCQSVADLTALTKDTVGFLCPRSHVAFSWQKEIWNVFGGRRNDFMLCRYIALVMWLMVEPWYVKTKIKFGYRLAVPPSGWNWESRGFSNRCSRSAWKCSSEIPVHHECCSVYKGLWLLVPMYVIPDWWGIARTVVEVEFGMDRCVSYHMAHRASRSPVSIHTYIQNGTPAVSVSMANGIL
jgi:hypothetical protein